MSNPSQKPQRPLTAAQRASEANKKMQYAVRTNTSRPNDRRPGDPQLQADHKTGTPMAAGKPATDPKP